eukprot:430668_1
MDPAIIGYSKTSDLFSHQLNEKEFGDYFIGLDKENQDTQNNTKENLFANDGNNQSISNHQQMDNINDNQNGLTPLNIDTKLSISEKETWISQQGGTRLYELPNNCDTKTLPPLPPTPSPPRMAKKRLYYQNQKKYNKQYEPLNNTHKGYNNHNEHYNNNNKHIQYDQNEEAYDYSYYYGDNNNNNNNNNNNYYYRYPYEQQEWYPNKDNYRKNSNFANNQYYDNNYGIQNRNYQSEDVSYFSNNKKIVESTNYNKNYVQGHKAPRFQREPNDNVQIISNNSSRNANVCKWWFKGAVCMNGSSCKWSHTDFKSDGSRKKRVTNYKTKPCVDPGRGLKCEYNDRCNFAHPGEALRRPMPIEYTDYQYFQLLLRDCPTNRFPFGIFV